jgi:hypothetical protein
MSGKAGSIAILRIAVGNTTLWYNMLWLKGTFKDKRYALGKVSATDAQGRLYRNGIDRAVGEPVQNMDLPIYLRVKTTSSICSGFSRPLREYKYIEVIRSKGCRK